MKKIGHEKSKNKFFVLASFSESIDFGKLLLYNPSQEMNVSLLDAMKGGKRRVFEVVQIFMQHT